MQQLQTLDQINSSMKHINLSKSPIQRILFHGAPYFVKRDDLLHPIFNGNKARKFLYYLQLQNPEITTISSCGGNQSNAMLALSALAQLRSWRFDYYLKPLPKQLKTAPNGNFNRACTNGMHWHEVDSFPTITSTDKHLHIEQGGADIQAEFGLSILANEIEQEFKTSTRKNCGIFLPSGTGTSAFFLQQHSSFPVYTTPCIGNSDYLKKQWEKLATPRSSQPIILEPKQRNRFGQPNKEHLAIWKKLLAETSIEFDLLYDPHGWLTLLEHRESLPAQLIYIHCGGLSGNASMLKRYDFLYNQLL